MPDLSLVNLAGWSLQVALLVIAAAIAARLMPVDAPAVRHAWWRTVLVLVVALPFVQTWRPARDLAMQPISVTATPAPSIGVGAAAHHGAVPTAPRFRDFARSWEPFVLVALATGAGVRLTWLAMGMVRLRRLRRAGASARASDLDDDLQRLVPEGTEIRYVDAVGQPVTFGFHRPVVLLPRELQALPATVQRAVVAHEMWHVRRHDWGWLVAEEILRAVFWFHPAIWWLISRIHTTREEVVDELTVLVTSSRRGYLEALLTFADQPPLFAAAPFARRRHLYHRMVLLSREAAMSSRRIVASCAGMVLVLIGAGWYGVSAFPLDLAPALSAPPSQPPRDPRPSDVRPATARETSLQQVIASTPDNSAAFVELARLQEDRGAFAEAEATLLAFEAAQPKLRGSYQAVAAFYNRRGQFDRTIRALEQAAALNPSDPDGYQILATYYYEKASKDLSLTPADRQTLIEGGLAATDRALAAEPEYLPALVYKNILLRQKANLVTDATERQALISESDALRAHALDLQKKNPPPPPPPAPTGGDARAMPPPPPPPPPPVDGRAPIRVGGPIRQPTQLVDVKPAYPAAARDAGISGVVIIEAVIDGSGDVREARVVRSIPLLDQPALDAVRQWKFTPTLLNGAPVPVVSTFTVNFSLR